MASSVVSLSLSNGTTTPQLKANSFRKFKLAQVHLRRISCSTSREISLESRRRVAPSLTCKQRRSVELLTRCGGVSSSSGDFPTEKGRSFGEWVEFVGEAVSTAFPVWVSLGCLLGLVKPGAFNWVTPDLTIIGLTITMLGMGMTLTLDDLRGALKMPKELFAGFLLQYSVGLLSL